MLFLKLGCATSTAVLASTTLRELDLGVFIEKRLFVLVEDKTKSRNGDGLSALQRRQHQYCEYLLFRSMRQGGLLA